MSVDPKRPSSSNATFLENCPAFQSGTHREVASGQRAASQMSHLESEQLLLHYTWWAHASGGPGAGKHLGLCR